MADLRLDTLTGDLDISSGGLSLIRGVEQSAQNLRTALTINLGEWFVDVLSGIPYINTRDPSIPKNTRYILGDKFPGQENYIKKRLDRYIRDLSYISSVSSTTNFDRSSREFSYKYKATTNQGDVIEDEFTSPI